ncbi:hypothetical protein [Myxococcus sp. SDU36]|uniref:hypothetical protein n=1 Tax=Myxococcus sp. SDU36 TaxID=2831967 RepID=UPI002543D38B|nr:hypothetical protein [Myxococcus sp. SDU36]WIG96403.1 hypothetical protein KGD87_02830 [Myxococcus sp. SDU36]
MARTTGHPPASRQVTLENRRRHCAACGGKVSADYRARRNVVTLSGVVALKVQVRVCHKEGCALHLRAIRAEEEGLWVLPEQELGLDVMALVGALRHQEQRSVPFIHAALRARGVPISERSVTNLIDRYEDLLALRVADSPHIQAVTHKLGRVVLGIGGLCPGLGDDRLWVLRDCLSGEVLAARSLPEGRAAELGSLIKDVARSLSVPITGVISCGQGELPSVVAAALPGLPHEFRPAHEGGGKEPALPPGAHRHPGTSAPAQCPPPRAPDTRLPPPSLRMKTLFVTLSTAMLLLAAPSARSAEPRRPPLALAYETYAYSGTLDGQATTVLAPALFASVPLTERWTLSAAWLFAYAPARAGGRTAFQAGNPSVGLGTVLWDDDIKVRTGAGLVLPFTLITDPDAAGSALLRRAATLRGNSAFSLVAPGLLGLTPWADASWRTGRLRLGLDGRLPMSVQLSEARGRRADAVVQLSGAANVDVSSNVIVGATLQAIYIATATPQMDPTHFALIPHVRLTGAAGFAEARLVINLDAPLGFSFSRGGLWAAALALGTTL